MMFAREFWIALVLPMTLGSCHGSSSDSSGQSGGNGDAEIGGTGGTGGAQTAGMAGFAGENHNPGGAAGAAGSTTPSARRVFFDDFESGDAHKWNQWDWETAPVVTTAHDGQGPHGGLHMAECNWNGIVEWNDPAARVGLHLTTWEYKTETFFRLWLRLDQDMDDKDGCKLFRIPFANDNDGNEIIFQRDVITADGAHEGISAHHEILVNLWGCRSFEDRQWHKIEYYIREGTDGVIRSWFDGVETICENSWGEGLPYFGNTHRTDAGWAGMYIASNWSNNPGWEHDALNHMYVDDIEIFTDADQGEPAVGSMADGSVHVP